MTALVEFAYYTGTFLGTSIASADWARLYLRAYQIVDQLTFGRATRIQQLIPTGATTQPAPAQVVEDTYQNEALEAVNIDEAFHVADVDAIVALKNAICAVAEEYQRLDIISGNREIASERVGNTSVTYVQNSTTQLSNDAKLKRVAKLWLVQTGLMYAGVSGRANEDLNRYWGWWWY
jgi:hypothetical protein